MIKVQLFIENPIQTNCWVLIDEETKEAVIIDLGGGYSKIKKYLDENGAKLKFVLCTHGHFDHIMGIPEMQQAEPKIPVYMNKKDKNLAMNVNDMLCHFGLREFVPQIKFSKFIDENTKDLFIGNNNIKVLETPGHTKGGLCFKINDMLFSGDSLFNREIGRCDLPGGDYDTLIQSLKTKLVILPEETDVYPGHGGKTTIGEEKKFNPYLQ